jgi:hypothetical protein
MILLLSPGDDRVPFLPRQFLVQYLGHCMAGDAEFGSDARHGNQISPEAPHDLNPDGITQFVAFSPSIRAEMGVLAAPELHRTAWYLGCETDRLQ